MTTKAKHLNFLGPKQLLSWLRFHPRAETIRKEIVTDEVLSWPKVEDRPKQEPVESPDRVLIVTQGRTVSVYVDGHVVVRHQDIPVVRTPAGNDAVDEWARKQLGFLWSELWEGRNHRRTFFVDGRTIQQRMADEWWRLL